MEEYREEFYKREEQIKNEIKTKKKIVFIHWQDYANVLTEWCRVINQNSQEWLAFSFGWTEHDFKYGIKHNYDFSKGIGRQIPMEIISEADIIIISLENEMVLKMIMGLFLDIDFRKQKIGVFHTGSYYRNNFKIFNNFFRRLFDFHIYAPDLYRLSPQQDNDFFFFPCVYSYEEVDFDMKFKEDKLLITHFPSNREIKGSDEIEEVIFELLEEYGDKFDYNVYPQIAHWKVYKELRKSVIHIDQINRDHGAYGVVTIEALKNGCLVLTTANNMPDKSKDKIIEVDDINDFREKLEYLMKKDKEELKQMLIDNYSEERFSDKKFYKMFEKKILKF